MQIPGNRTWTSFGGTLFSIPLLYYYSISAERNGMGGAEQKDYLEDNRTVSLEGRGHPEQHSLLFLFFIFGLIGGDLESQTKEFGIYDGGNPINVGLDRIVKIRLYNGNSFHMREPKTTAGTRSEVGPCDPLSVLGRLCSPASQTLRKCICAPYGSYLKYNP